MRDTWHGDLGMQTNRLTEPLYQSAQWLGLDAVALGTIMGFLSALAYTAANVCLRAVAHCDPIWVSCVKAFPTVVLVLPWLIGRAVRSQAIVSSLRLLLLLIACAIFGQLCGNVLFQWSLGIVGIALTVPLTLGTMILSSTLLGRHVLREHVSRRMTISIWVLILAICILSLGAPAANRSISGVQVDGFSWVRAMYVAAGVLAACISGVAYCVLSGAIRYTASRGMPLPAILFAVTLVGLLSLGAITGVRIGPTAMLDTSSSDLAVMLLAGVCNALAFGALAKALQLTGLVYVHALNASQTAMAAVAGILFFHEAPSLAMATGVVLTAAGLLLVRNDGRVPDTAHGEVETVTSETSDGELASGEAIRPATLDAPAR